MMFPSIRATYLLRHMRVAIVSASLILLLAACGATSHTAAAKPTPTATATPTNTATPTMTPAQYQQLLTNLTPVRIINTKIHLNAPILPVQVNARGEMNVYDDAPAGDPKWDSAFWYAPGAYPGQVGNAVIAAHVNRPTPGPGPFGLLTNIAVGDQFQVQTLNATTLTFTVTQIASAAPGPIDAADPTIDSVFGPTSTPSLNLITCTDFNGSRYTERLIVYTQLVGLSPFPIMPQG